MTLKELITDYNTKRTQSICMIPKAEVDLEKIKQDLESGRYWIMDIETGKTIPTMPKALYEEQAAFCAETQMQEIDIVIKSDRNMEKYWRTHTHNKTIKNKIDIPLFF